MSETNLMSRELQTAAEIARKAGGIMLQYFDADQQVERKGDGSPVTVADKLINRMVIEELSEAFPSDGIIGEEESTAEYGAGRKWFCDPIDGTLAYTWGTPTSLFSLGLVVDGQPKVGVVYDPYLDRIYTTEEGRGSFCNSRQLKASDKTLENGVVAVTSDARRIAKGLGYVDALVDAQTKIATFSGAIYKAILVASGRFVGYIEHGVSAHDMAAVHLIVEEAGGKVTGIDGQEYDYTKPFKGTVVSNGLVHDQLVEYAQK